MKTALAVLALSASTLLAQSYPDCRTPGLAIGSLCVFSGTSLPTQQTIGNISLPPAQSALMTEPLMTHYMPSPAATGRSRNLTIGGLYTQQRERGFSNYALASDGLTAYADTQLSKHFGVEARVLDIQYDVIPVGLYPGQNHTFSASVGPIERANFGRVSLYLVELIGVSKQQWYGLNLGAAAGVDVRVAGPIYWRTDLSFGYDGFSNEHNNPVKGRQQFGTGFAYRFGSNKAQ